MNPISIYDEVAFPSLPHASSHPERLATIARLRGLEPPSAVTCRVLELGCGAGGNILPLADTLPNCEFVGIDLSAQQIDIAAEHAIAANLRNIHFRAEDILHYDAQGKSFDYILCHGVFSWTSDPVRNRILALLNDLLAPRGIAYLNYNTYPGWHVQGFVRDALSFRARRFAEPAERVRAARATIELLLGAIGPADSPPRMLLRQELESARKHSDAYLFHAYLNVVNQPFYLHEVVERAELYGLQYVGDADPGSMWPDLQGTAIDQRLQQLLAEPFATNTETTHTPSSDVAVVDYEQFYDLARFSTSRRSLFCRAGSPVRATPADDLADMHVSASLRPASPDTTSSGTSNWIALTGRTIKTAEPRMTHTFALLSEAWPESRSSRWLTDEVERRLNAPLTPESRALWVADLLRCFTMGIVDISVRPNPCTRQVDEKPRTTVLTRRLAASQPLVTNLRHTAVRLGELERAVLQHLDGQQSFPQIVQVTQQDETGLRQALSRLAAGAFLVRGGGE